MEKFEITKENIVFWGAGYWGQKWLDIFMELGLEIRFFIDNNPHKQGKTIRGVPIISPQIIIESKEHFTFFITTSKNNDLIRKQLVELGIDSTDIILFDDIYKSRNIKVLIYEKLLSESKERDNQYNLIYDDSGRLRILYDDQVFSMQRHGGISRYFYELTEGLGRNDIADVFLFKGINISEIEFDKKVHSLFSCKAGGVTLGDYSIRKCLNRELIRRYVTENSRYDVYHPTYYDDYKLDYYKRKIITVHDMIHELFGLDNKTIEDKRRMVQSADGIIAVSESTKRDLVYLLNIPEDKVKVIYHGNSLCINVDEERLISEPYILYVGERDGYKNFDALARAYARSSHTKDLVLVCFGGRPFNREEFELFKTLEIYDRVKQISGSDRLLANLYKYAELFVYPSMYEGFGIPLLEAMHYGTPIITGNVSSMPEVAGDAAEYFDPNSVEELKKKIDELLDDDEKKRNIIHNGYVREKEFSWNKTVKETYDYYMSVLQ